MVGVSTVRLLPVLCLALASFDGVFFLAFCDQQVQALSVTSVRQCDDLADFPSAFFLQHGHRKLVFVFCVFAEGDGQL
jgi:hypothetical protein